MDHGLVEMSDLVSEIVSKETLGLFFIIIGFYAVVFQIKRLKMWFSITLGLGLIYAGLVLSGS
jgi:hypothetical protein